MAEMQKNDVKIEPGWRLALLEEFNKPYMQQLRKFLRCELDLQKQIYPACGEYFAAFNETPLENVKVVILGQDPYHGPRQAHGLCFSVRPEIAIPPSLKNIYKEMESDLGIKQPLHGHLTHWAQQGVLLLNATLTVEAGKAGSHQGKGWEQFTDQAIAILNENGNGLVFMLWGSYAQKKGAFIDTKKHLVLRAPHPSPLSAHRGFLGCRHFSQANEYLKAQGKQVIDWQLPDLHRAIENSDSASI